MSGQPSKPKNETPATEEAGRTGARTLLPVVPRVFNGRLGTAALIKAIERLENIIDLETAALRHNSPPDLREFNHKKSQGLLELSRAMKALEGLGLDERTREPLGRLREKLGTNLAALDMHLTAIREVSNIIARAIQDAESDGTYSASAGGRRSRK